MPRRLHLSPSFSLPQEAVAETFGVLAMREKIAWAAGLFEGEGCIRFDLKAGTRRLVIRMTDEDVLWQFRNVVGAGSIRVAQEPIGNRKRQFVWNCSNWPDVKRILESFLPFLCQRRSAKALELLANPRRYGMGICKVCNNNLRGPDADVYRYETKVQCGPCARRRSRESHHRKKLA